MESILRVCVCSMRKLEAEGTEARVCGRTVTHADAAVLVAPLCCHLVYGPLLLPLVVWSKKHTGPLQCPDNSGPIAQFICFKQQLCVHFTHRKIQTFPMQWALTKNIHLLLYNTSQQLIIFFIFFKSTQ